MNIDRALIALAAAERECAAVRIVLPREADGQTVALADHAAECCRAAANCLRVVVAREGRRAETEATR